MMKYSSALWSDPMSVLVVPAFFAVDWDLVDGSIEEQVNR